MHGREGTPMVSFLKQGLSGWISITWSAMRSFATTTTAKQTAVVQAEPAMLVVESPYSLEETVESVKRAAVGKNFRLIRDQILEDGLFPAEQQNTQRSWCISAISIFSTMPWRWTRAWACSCPAAHRDRT